MSFEDKEFKDLINKFREVKQGEKIKIDENFKRNLKHELVSHGQVLAQKPSFWKRWRYVLTLVPSALGVFLIVIAVFRNDLFFARPDLNNDRLPINIDAPALPIPEDGKAKIYFPGMGEEESDASTTGDEKNVSPIASPNVKSSPKTESITSVTAPDSAPKTPLPRATTMPQAAPEAAPPPEGSQMPAATPMPTLSEDGVYTSSVKLAECNLAIQYDSAIESAEKESLKNNIILPLLSNLKEVRSIYVSPYNGGYKVNILWCDGRTQENFF